MLLPLNEAIKASRIQYELFLFDFDGIILESVEARNQAFWELFNEYSEDVCDNILRLHKDNPGIDRKDKILRCYEEVLQVTPNINELNQRIQRFGDLALKKVLECPVIDGVLSFISKLDKNKCYIVSAARQDEVRYIADKRGLSNYFADIFGGPENKITLINTILNSKNIAPEKAVFIGDKKNDWTAAHNTGVGFYGRVAAESTNPFPDKALVFKTFVA